MVRRLLVLASAFVALPVLASHEFLELQLEDLLKIEIGSASRKLQQVQDVAAAVFVISRDDIARSGARSIPEVLRLAPGVEVAHISNGSWAVSIRGFNAHFANKLLVLKDGRNVYSPLYSGVLWEAEDAVLEDIERIEVIRGPSAAMWGANAVNGVINIISRSAADAQGTELIAASATNEPSLLTLRHGFSVGDSHWRISAKGFEQAAGRAVTGEKGNDSWTAGRLGLRGDWLGGDGSRWMMVGEAYHSRTGSRLEMPGGSAAPSLLDVSQTNSGANLLLNRQQTLADGGQIDWQISAESTALDLQNFIREDRDTLAAEFHRRLPLGAHELLWGASYRYSHDHLDLPPSAIPEGFAFDRPHRDSRMASVFVHDAYALVPQRLALSGGVRVSYDSWSGTQAQPDVRLAWTPNAATTWWTSLARAARTPSRLELDGIYPLGETAANPPFAPAAVMVRLPPATDTLKAEVVTSLEAGVRHRVNEKLSFDVAAFASNYADLMSTVTLTPRLISPDLLVVPLSSNNDASARTHGLELAADWQVTPHWRIQPNYSWLRLSSPRLGDPATSAMQAQLEGRVARHRASLRSSWMLEDGSQLDLWLKGTSSLGDPYVAGYCVVSARYAFQLGRNAEIAITGQNLLDHHHLEFISETMPTQRIEIARSLQVKGTWRF
jgi:iron complex outermembrane receptor protein